MQTKMEYLLLVLAWLLFTVIGAGYVFILAYIFYGVTRILLKENKNKNKYGKGSK